MIELPEGTVPGNASHELLDYGFLQRGALGGATQRINRKGNRYRLSLSYGPYAPEQARVLVGLLNQAKSEGIRIPYPLLVDQGSAGSPTVDGAGQAGTSLDITGLTAGYTCRAGYWLSIENADGRHYLHNVVTGGVADANGDLTVTITPELRHPFADGATIHLTKPMVEGWIDGESWSWNSPVDRVVPIQFTLEEAE